MNILIFGNGFIAHCCKEAWGEEAIITDRKIYTIDEAEEEIKKHNPDAVVNAAGVTGRPNVDWCEDHPRESMLGNVLMPIALAEACQREGKYVLHMGSGCIFYGDSPHPDNKWREDDFGNPSATYSRHKWAADLALTTLPNVGIARIRMPIDAKPSDRNLIDKLARYPKIIDVENSVTIVDDMTRVLYELVEKRAAGIFHVVNPGIMKHRQLIALYNELVDPAHTNEWIPNDDLVRQGLATKGRSNNFLASERLAAIGIEMREVHEALRDTMERYAAYKKQESAAGME